MTARDPGPRVARRPGHGVARKRARRAGIYIGLIVAIATILYFRTQDRWVHYQ